MPRVQKGVLSKDKKINKPFKNGHTGSIPNQSKHQLAAENSLLTPEQYKKQLAQQALNKLVPRKHSVEQDDFFVVDREQAKKAEHDLISQQLNQQYMRKQNRLFEDLSTETWWHQFDNPIQYRGHTKCITAFEVTPQHIYSCSKDRSIIQWDRETKQKTFISLGKDQTHHRSDILSLAFHPSIPLLATAGEDCTILLWDPRSSGPVHALTGHKNTINGLKFGSESHNLCSVSADLTLKHWDVSQRGLISTYYQHNAEVLDIDSFNADDFLTAGYDRQLIAWKTEKETKIIYKGHHYAVDRARTINSQRFVTACQDGSIYLWHTRKTKPVFKLNNAHAKGWISALDNIKQTNMLASAGIDHTVKLWTISPQYSGLSLVKQLAVEGIVTDLKFTKEMLAVAECDELRLGRWITDKCRNKNKIFPVQTRNL